VLPKAHAMRGRAPATSLVALLLAVSAAVTMVLAERGGPGPRAVSASSATSQDELFYSAGAVEREEELLQEARVTGEATSREQQTGRALLQFNDVGNIFSNGYGGFPNSLYRGFGLFPSSCFTIGLLNPLYLAQCFSFTTSF